MIDDIKKKLWATADKLRANMDAAQYKPIVLGLIFVKYISDTLQIRRTELQGRRHDLENHNYYKAENVFRVPEAARWESLRAQARQADIGQRIDDALVLIEIENPKLKGILDKCYARLQLPNGNLGELVDLLSEIGIDEDGDSAKNHARDLPGQIYDYFLAQFAMAEGKRGGQFYTPPSIVKTLVAVLAPHQGQVYDPCCGSGGMFVQSARFIEAHGGKFADVSIHGQEANPTNWRLAAMNLLIRGIKFDLGGGPSDVFTHDQHPDLRADFVLASPPFNMSGWWHDSLAADVRWVYGMPPQGNANYAWLQHMLYHLNPDGRAGVVLPNSSASSTKNGEGDIRRRMLEADKVEIMIALPGQLLLDTRIPVCLWFLAQKKQTRQGQVLFIDAHRLGHMASRVQCELTDEVIGRIAATVAAWRGEGGEYANVAGFCRSVGLAEIAGHGHVLTPGRYVGAQAVEDDDGDFAGKMQKLTTRLTEQMDRGAELDALIRQHLVELGYDA